MDEYIYSLPPPPPPPPPVKAAGSSSSSSKLNKNEQGSRVLAGNSAVDADAPDMKRSRLSDDSQDSDLSLIETMKKASENIEDWIAQRRKNWPSNKRVQEKKDQENRNHTRSESGAVSGSELQAAAKKRPCRYFAAKGTCRLGDKCTFSHEKKFQRFEGAGKSALFKRLLQADMSEENEQILSFIELLNRHGYLEPTSLR